MASDREFDAAALSIDVTERDPDPEPPVRPGEDVVLMVGKAVKAVAGQIPLERLMEPKNREAGVFEDVCLREAGDDGGGEFCE